MAIDWKKISQDYRNSRPDVDWDKHDRERQERLTNSVAVRANYGSGIRIVRLGIQEENGKKIFGIIDDYSGEMTYMSYSISEEGFNPDKVLRKFNEGRNEFCFDAGTSCTRLAVPRSEMERAFKELKLI